jgi:NTP pyrophosphatase (non-canonical NTP hydrolase)
MSDDRDVWAGDGERYEGDDRPCRTVTSRRDLSLDDYQREATRTAVYPGHGEAMGLAYVCLGLAGEAGEIANKAKKVLRDASGELTDDRRDALAHELGDVLSELGVPLGALGAGNLSKLADRAARGAIKGDGDQR